MIIGDNKEAVIENIKKATELEEFNKKVEVNDPKLSDEQRDEIINKYLSRRKKITYKLNNRTARMIADTVSWSENKVSRIEGLDNIQDIKTGAIITSNHFNPLDSLIIRKMTKKVGKKHLYIVAQETNLAMPGLIGYMMNYTDIIPISRKISYIKHEFSDIIEEKLNKKHFILIYPEQEMWFNYKKPRPPKPGAYYFAAKNNVPIISCFVEMVDTGEEETAEFNKLKYVLHVLPPIYPDKEKTHKENSKIMMEIDYRQKIEAYEKAYNKSLDYSFKYDDIAGLKI